ncbi:hypothetical protein Tco_0682210 [Tanacetum coccineum]|uniref:Uncharacterized protein n=1 Tax=Tanacetum coccineum TaxID=301880 RepID=A0ABQ4XR80_9ASTR
MFTEFSSDDLLLKLSIFVIVQGLVYLILSNSSNVFSKSKMTKSFSFKPARSVSIRRIFAAIAEMPSGGEESPSSSSRGMRSFLTSEEDLCRFDYRFGLWFLKRLVVIWFEVEIDIDRQALGAVSLSLAKNVAYNVVNEKTTYNLFKAQSNMYEKPSASNKVFLIRQLVNTKMKEGAFIADHVNAFNSILSRLMLVDIKFDGEVQALLLLSSLRESWSGTVITVSGSTRSTKLKFDNIYDLILREDIRRKTSREYSNSLLSVEDKIKGRKKDRGRSKTYVDQNQRREDKEVHMAVRDYDDALVCCVENTVEDCIRDFGASFHATFCKEELEKFRLDSDKFWSLVFLGILLKFLLHACDLGS